MEGEGGGPEEGELPAGFVPVGESISLKDCADLGCKDRLYDEGPEGAFETEAKAYLGEGPEDGCRIRCPREGGRFGPEETPIEPGA